MSHPVSTSNTTAVSKCRKCRLREIKFVKFPGGAKPPDPPPPPPPQLEVGISAETHTFGTSSKCLCKSDVQLKSQIQGLKEGSVL